jgi:hypothetical protein
MLLKDTSLSGTPAKRSDFLGSFCTDKQSYLQVRLASLPVLCVK